MITVFRELPKMDRQLHMPVIFRLVRLVRDARSP